MAGTHAGRHDQQEISGADAPIHATKSHKGLALHCWNVIRRRRGQILWNLADGGNFICHVGVSYSLATLDFIRRSDWLAILQNMLTLWNITESKSIPRSKLR